MKKRILLCLSLLLVGCDINFSLNLSSSNNESSFINSNESGDEDSISNDSASNGVVNSEVTSQSSVSSIDESEFLPYSEAVKVTEFDDPNAWNDNDELNIEERGEVVSKKSTWNIFEINDTHGALDTANGNPGMDKVESLIKDLQKSDDYINILNGDIFQGGWLSNKTHGKAFVDIINQMDFDCFVIGNHEFDWGLDVIQQYKDGDEENGELNIPFLGCNIYYKDTNTHPSFIDPYTIVNTNGYKIGIIGVIGEDQYSSISTDKAKPFEFKNTDTLIKKFAKELREKKDCDYVVLSTHDYTEENNSLYATFSGNEAVDAIICAHTHQKISETVTRKDGYAIPVIQSNTKNGTAGIINFNVNNSNLSYSMSHKYPNNYTQDETIKNAIAKYNDIIEDGESIIGKAPTSFSKETIGRDATEYFNEKYNTVAAFVNTSGVRGTIAAGNIKMSKLLEVFPFDNKMMVVRIQGRYLRAFINNNLSYYYYNLKINTSNINNNEYYLITVFDFIYTRGNSFVNSTFKYTGTLILDDYIECVRNKYSA